MIRRLLCLAAFVALALSASVAPALAASISQRFLTSSPPTSEMPPDPPTVTETIVVAGADLPLNETVYLDIFLAMEPGERAFTFEQNLTFEGSLDAFDITLDLSRVSPAKDPFGRGTWEGADSNKVDATLAIVALNSDDNLGGERLVATVEITRVLDDPAAVLDIFASFNEAFEFVPGGMPDFREVAISSVASPILTVPEPESTYLLALAATGIAVLRRRAGAAKRVRASRRHLRVQ